MKVRLKYLTYCLLGLSVSGCTQHVIKTNSATQDSSNRVISGLNALYETPSYDYHGQFKVAIQPDESTKDKSLDQKLDAQVQQKVERSLSEQGIRLSQKEKQQLYRAIAQQTDHVNDDERLGRVEKMMDMGINILNDVQFSYDGSVHYRERMGSLNLTARYEKPTLLVQAKLPMIVDFKDYKFYTNYFAFMPYLVNRENQNNLAYIDFSKYQNFFKQVDMKKFVEYFKASGAVPYMLARPEQFQKLPLNSKDQAAGVVEKIRVNSTLEEFMLQADLYNKVNAQYLTRSVLGLNEDSLEQWAEKKGEQLAQKTPVTTAKLSPELEAYDASQKLYASVTEKWGVTESVSTVEEDQSDEGIDQNNDEITSVHEDQKIVQNEESALLTEQQCSDLQSSHQSVVYGDINYCQDYYGIDVFSEPKASEKNQQARQKKLETIFATYDQNKWIDEYAFKTLWLKYQSEIDQTLPPLTARTPFIMDMGLDAQGRLVSADYDLNLLLPQTNRRVHFNMDMQITNYGKGTPISRQQLKQAKPLSEVSKGSFLEKVVGGLTQSLGNDPSSALNAPSSLSFNQQLEQLAAQVYDQTHSYEKTFSAVFTTRFSADYPEYVRHYSAQDLKEIANVYAYWYSDEDVYDPQGQVLREIQALQKKHHLELDEQFDNELGSAVDEIVIQSMKKSGERQNWQQLKKRYKQPQQLFAVQYQSLFEKQEDVDSSRRPLLAQTSKILGQFFVDAHQQKLTEKSLQGLAKNHLEFIDYKLFEQVYRQMLSELGQ
ncbi:hypothetical protein IAE19_12510 [Acinetobacter sp. S40]|uniref:hypothetical protein n=1 Tax=Acinetobacter sp. S40 TaxID=2767434 RepID=UPI001909CC81|nr:hypothetical protein [Acinetobacter sp. S40]MBJ9986255.1 hypothetical protein [Acinetobacter sp. S40]